MQNIMRKFSLFLLLFCSVASYGKDNEISLEVSNGIHQDKRGNYALLLPILPQYIEANTALTIKNGDRVLSAEFSLINTWPTVAAKEYKLERQFIRLLLVEIAGEKSLPQALTLSWHTLSPVNSTKQKLLALSFKTMPSNVALVYPSLSWLSQSVLLHDIGNVNADWYLEPQKKYANYITNSALLNQKGYPETRASQWLYDRAQAIYQLYVMTGDSKWQISADQLSLFYQQHIDETGQFTLKKQFDPKMLMPKGLLYRFFLSGDFEAKKTLQRMFEKSLDWDESYNSWRGFWTERNQAAALNVAVSYWELSNEPNALKRINDIINATVEMTFNPGNDWPLRGCPQHSFKAHEGWGDNSPICSPWMMALLGDALWRFYLLSGDKRAASLIDAFGDFILNHGIYYGNKRVNNIVIPKYLVSMENPSQEELNQWTDPQHACDVAALLGKSVYIKQQTKQDGFLVETLFAALTEQCKASYVKWLKEQKSKQPKAYWEIKPPRRFAWMYSTTSDLPWLAHLILGANWATN